MRDTTSGRHPIHVARSDRTLVVERIGVKYLSFEEVRDRLQPDVRMRRHVEQLRRDVGLIEMVEEYKTTDAP